MSMATAGVTPGNLDSIDAGINPFWFDLWEKVGWSGRVERIWAKDTAYRGNDQSFLERVLPTLAPQHKSFVENVLRQEQALS